MSYDNLSHTTHKGKVVYRRKKHIMTQEDRIRILGPFESLHFNLGQINEILTGYTNRVTRVEANLEVNLTYLRETFALVLNLWQMISQTPQLPSRTLQQMFDIVAKQGRVILREQKDELFEGFLHMMEPFVINWWLDVCRNLFYYLQYDDSAIQEQLCYIAEL